MAAESILDLTQWFPTPDVHRNTCGASVWFLWSKACSRDTESVIPAPSVGPRCNSCRIHSPRGRPAWVWSLAGDACDQTHPAPFQNVIHPSRHEGRGLPSALWNPNPGDLFPSSYGWQSVGKGDTSFTDISGRFNTSKIRFHRIVSWTLWRYFWLTKIATSCGSTWHWKGLQKLLKRI